MEVTINKDLFVVEFDKMLRYYNHTIDNDIIISDYMPCFEGLDDSEMVEVCNISKRTFLKFPLLPQINETKSIVIKNRTCIKNRIICSTFENSKDIKNIIDFVKKIDLFCEKNEYIIIKDKKFDFVPGSKNNFFNYVLDSFEKWSAKTGNTFTKYLENWIDFIEVPKNEEKNKGV